MSDPDDELLNKLKQAAETPPPPGWRPGVIYSGRMPSEIVTPPMKELSNSDEYEAAVKALGFPLPDGMSLELVEAQYVYHENAWTRENQGEDAVTKPSASWRYRFKVVPKSDYLSEDLKSLFEEIASATPHAPVGRKYGGTMVVNLADAQIGKVDERGGTRETLERAEAALQAILARVALLQPKAIILADNGDSTEGYNSGSGNSDRVNDVQEIEALRIWRRLFWRWTHELSKVTDDLTVLSVPSNHCRNRQGKKILGPISDDWGLDALSTLADRASENPGAYGHVKFLVPGEYDEHITLDVEGKIVTFAHGHEAGNPKKATEWIKKMGRHPIGISDIVVLGHFHRLSLETFGDSQLLIIVSTLDPGSSWYTVRSGERSDAGVTSFVVDEKGLRDLHLAG